MERIFIPGSRWLFFKLYTGTQSADILLTRHISPFVRRLRESGAIDDFFFIRYTDPLFHLRLRLHLPDTSRYGEVFGAFGRGGPGRQRQAGRQGQGNWVES